NGTPAGSWPGAQRPALSALQRHHHYRNRHGVLPGLWRGAPPVRRSELLPVLRTRPLPRTLESREEEVAHKLVRAASTLVSTPGFLTSPSPPPRRTHMSDPACSTGTPPTSHPVKS